VVALLDRLLKRASPSLRHALWGLVLVKLLLPPSLVSPLGWRTEEGIESAGAGSAASSAGGGWVVALFLAWLVLVVVLATTRVIARRRHVARWLVDARPATGEPEAAFARAVKRLGLRRPPTLLLAPGAPGPLTLGLLRPVVLLPTDALDSATPHDLEHVLLHECAHVQRGDLWFAWVWDWVRLLYAWHPLVAWSARRAHGVREACCDTTVAAALPGAASAYRDTLLRMACRALGSTAPAGASAFLGAGDGIAERLRALERNRPPRPWSSSLLALALGLVVVPLAAAVVPSAAEREREDARAALATLLPHRPGSGCLPLRYAVMRAVASADSVPRTP
jgi:beta-lactamase regulating signal transducer with metallopeptidase domain